MDIVVLKTKTVLYLLMAAPVAYILVQSGSMEKYEAFAFWMVIGIPVAGFIGPYLFYRALKDSVKTVADGTFKEASKKLPWRVFAAIFAGATALSIWGSDYRPGTGEPFPPLLILGVVVLSVLGILTYQVIDYVVKKFTR